MLLDCFFTAEKNFAFVALNVHLHHVWWWTGKLIKHGCFDAAHPPVFPGHGGAAAVDKIR